MKELQAKRSLAIRGSPDTLQKTLVNYEVVYGMEMVLQTL